jgi:2-C-methyl-D-erythritol 4-phosphate cytidylyltransferase
LAIEDQEPGSVVVIVPAAGTGSRFGGQLPKQFLPLGGKPVIQHVIERFLLDPIVARVIVPVADALLASVRQASTDRVTWVAGGETRQQSVIRGLAEAGDAELVAVHDAARPLFSTELFRAVVQGARDFGAALPVVPVSDTIHVMNEDATIASTLDRTMLGSAQTPQCFRASLLREILERAQAEGLEGTDEAGLAARFGHPVRGVPGDPRNLKITVPEDLAIAESYLEQWSRIQ